MDVAPIEQERNDERIPVRDDGPQALDDLAAGEGCGELILLKPEHGANVAAWEREEQAALEAMFRKQSGSKT